MFFMRSPVFFLLFSWFLYNYSPNWGPLDRSRWNRDPSAARCHRARHWRCYGRRRWAPGLRLLRADRHLEQFVFDVWIFSFLKFQRRFLSLVVIVNYFRRFVTRVYMIQSKNGMMYIAIYCGTRAIDVQHKLYIICYKLKVETNQGILFSKIRLQDFIIYL